MERLNVDEYNSMINDRNNLEYLKFENILYHGTPYESVSQIAYSDGSVGIGMDSGGMRM